MQYLNALYPLLFPLLSFFNSRAILILPFPFRYYSHNSRSNPPSKISSLSHSNANIVLLYRALCTHLYNHCISIPPTPSSVLPSFSPFPFFFFFSISSLYMYIHIQFRYIHVYVCIIRRTLQRLALLSISRNVSNSTSASLAYHYLFILQPILFRYLSLFIP